MDDVLQRTDPRKLTFGSLQLEQNLVSFFLATLPRPRRV